MPAPGPGRLPPGPWFLAGGGCRGSDAQGLVLKIISAKRLEMIFGRP